MLDIAAIHSVSHPNQFGSDGRVVLVGVQNPHLEKWIMERDDVFFELQTNWEGNGGEDSRDMKHVADIEIMASKTYLKGLILVVIFSEGSYFAQIQDGGGRTQALLDVKYPDLSSKGRGHKIKSFSDSHATYTDLYIWAPADDAAAKKPKKKAAVAKKAPAESKVDLMGEGGAYNQTYVVFKNIIANQTLEPLRRDVFFRFGLWPKSLFCILFSVLCPARLRMVAPSPKKKRGD